MTVLFLLETVRLGQDVKKDHPNMDGDPLHSSLNEVDRICVEHLIQQGHRSKTVE